jgi:AraC-like DNA-binding protein
LHLDATHLFRDSFDAGSECIGDLPPGALIAVIGADLARHIRWFGMLVTPEDVAVSARRIDVKAAGTGRFYAVALDKKRVVDSVPGRRCDGPVLDVDRNGYLVRNPSSTERFRECLQAVFALIDTAPSVLSRASLRATVENTVIDLLRRAIAGRWIAPCTSVGRRVEAVRACELYMRFHIDEPISLQDLSDFSGLRPRSLISAFEVFTGFTPMAYLKVQRLAGVRRALLSTTRNCLRIIDVAMDWGFVHMGHFAADYREMFGEKPSETRRAARSEHGYPGGESFVEDPSAARRCLAELMEVINRA